MLTLDKSCRGDTFGHYMLCHLLVTGKSVLLMDLQLSLQITVHHWLNEASIVNGVFNTFALNSGKCRDNIHFVPTG